MKLSLRGEYALRALIELGSNYSSEVVPIQYISKQQAVPKRFLEQILNDLKSGGFVESKRGISGGYRLAAPPDKLLLAPILAHIEGPLVLAVRTGTLGSAAAAAQHAVDSVVQDVHKAISGVLEEITLAELCNRARRWKSDLAAVSDYAI